MTRLSEVGDLLESSKKMDEWAFGKRKSERMIDLYHHAVKAGKEAMGKCTPTPMIVSQHQNMLDDNSPVEKEYYVPQGVCGFAWVNVKAKGKGLTFINALKKEGLATKKLTHAPFRKDHYYGGYTHWVREGGQSYEIKCAYAYAFAEVLHEAGLPCHAMSRLD